MQNKVTVLCLFKGTVFKTSGDFCFNFQHAATLLNYMTKAVSKASHSNYIMFAYRKHSQVPNLIVVAVYPVWANI